VLSLHGHLVYSRDLGEEFEFPHPRPLGNGNVRAMIRELEDDGWSLARQRGSHRQYHHPTKPGTVTVPDKMSDDLQRPLVASIVKQAGLEGRTR